jgi:hypothetical protein
LIHHVFSFEDVNVERLGGLEECVGDAGHSRLVHHQDRAALLVELPPASEDEALNVWDLSASPNEIGGEARRSAISETYAPALALISNPRTSYE